MDSSFLLCNFYLYTKGENENNKKKPKLKLKKLVLTNATLGLLLDMGQRDME
jgi:hypothetical protein